LIANVSALTDASNGALSFAWYSSSTLTGTYTAIVGATFNTFTLTQDQTLKYVKLIVSYKDGRGSIESTIYITHDTLRVDWILKQTLMNTSGNDLNPTIAVDRVGNVYGSYFTNGAIVGGTNLGGNDIVVFKLNSLGELQWIQEQQLMNTSGNDLNPTIVIDKNGVIYVSYYTDGTVIGGTNSGGQDIVVLKMINVLTQP
jgi:hypothetical protein